MISLKRYMFTARYDDQLVGFLIFFHPKTVEWEAVVEGEKENYKSGH